MKGTKSRYALFLILSLLLMPLLNFMSILPVKGVEQVFFEDDFESYQVGTFPSSGGWELWYDGMGSEYQVIVDNVSSSPTKSLQLLGKHEWNWAAYAARPFVTDQPIIGFNVSVKVSEIGDRDRVIAQVGFGQNLPPNRVTTFAPIYFLENGTISVSGFGAVLPYVAEKWYKVTVIMDRNSETYSVWIDNVLQGQNLTVRTNRGAMTASESTWDIEGFDASQDFYSVKVFFDDVKVFSVFDVDPKLKLVPATGIAATTLVGSGFAPNSEISVTWDNIPIPTVPSPLITDGYGNFTAIISVLNQTTSGVYIVKAVDEIGTKATATFTVTLGSPSQTHITAHITVPDDYSTIQEAINHADDGDTIIVKSGTYYEHIVVNKVISLIGENKRTTIIDGNATGTVVSITANSVIVSGFTLQNCGNYPGRILQANSNGNKITCNVILNNGDGKGISLDGSMGNIVSDNEVSNTFDGIILSGSSYNIVSNNIVSHNGYGIYIYTFSDNNLIFANNVSSCSNMGMFLGPVSASSEVISGNVVSNNTILSSDTGIMLGGRSSNSTLIDNVIKRNSWGIYLQGTTNNTITGNDIRDNSLGIYMDGQCNYTQFYYNDFINNSRQVNNRAASRSLPIYWDNGYPSGGNYWSDYNGTDADGDEIGDTPYIIDENNQDNYPLMSPYKPPPSYQLIVDSTPSGAVFIAHQGYCTAPWSKTYTQITTVSLTMPEAYYYQGEKYVWSRWSDGNTDRKRTVTVNRTIALTALFTQENTTGNAVTTEKPSGAPNQYEMLSGFPLWAIPPLFLVTTASTLAVRKRLPIPAFKKISSRLHRLLT
jgi:nitrous oxidase accessory protein